MDPTWREIRCAIWGHRWRVHAINTNKARQYKHLDCLAGCLAQCWRCGYVLDDYNEDLTQADLIRFISEGD